MNCSNCGNENDAGTTFCNHCGAQLARTDGGQPASCGPPREGDHVPLAGVPIPPPPPPEKDFLPPAGMPVNPHWHPEEQKKSGLFGWLSGWISRKR